jgi:hypothetical protein
MSVENGWLIQEYVCVLEVDKLMVLELELNHSDLPAIWSIL